MQAPTFIAGGVPPAIELTPPAPIGSPESVGGGAFSLPSPSANGQALYGALPGPSAEQASYEALPGLSAGQASYGALPGPSAGQAPYAPPPLSATGALPYGPPPSVVPPAPLAAPVANLPYDSFSPSSQYQGDSGGDSRFGNYVPGMHWSTIR